ncbi:MAG: hypothetical protein LUE63_00870, partial [Lachnospiraceae bacterium]|nr:hypothetical protein [Lachnospiraceae bacterium]
DDVRGSGAGRVSGSGSGSSAGSSSSGSNSGSSTESSAGSDSGSSAGTDSGTGSGDEGSGSGAGTDSGTGSGDEGSGSGAGTDSGSGSGDEGSGSGSETDTGTGTGTGTGSGSSTGSGSGSGDGSSTGTGDSTGDGSGDESGTGTDTGDVVYEEIEWAKPVPSFSTFEMDVYSLASILSVEDEAGVFDRVILTLAWDTSTTDDPTADTQVQYRKTLKTTGAFSIDNLPPGTKIYLMAYLQYYDADGNKVRESVPFYEGIVTTAELASTDGLCIEFSDETESYTGNYYENQIMLYNLSISGANAYVVDKVSYGYLEIYKEGETDAYASIKLSSGTVKKYKYTSLTYQTSLTQVTLDANTEYRYRILLYDRYNNCFNDSSEVYWGYEEQESPDDYASMTGYPVSSTTLYSQTATDSWDAESTLVSGNFWGYTHTSKTQPSADITALTISDAQTRLYESQMTIQITDPHSALQAASGSLDDIAGELPTDSEGTEYKIYYELYLSGESEPLSVYVTETDDGVVITIPDEDLSDE